MEDTKMDRAYIPYVLAAVTAAAGCANVIYDGDYLGSHVLYKAKGRNASLRMTNDKDVTWTLIENNRREPRPDIAIRNDGVHKTKFRANKRGEPFPSTAAETFQRVTDGIMKKRAQELGDMCKPTGTP
jgi:hypothetical protein